MTYFTEKFCLYFFTCVFAKRKIQTPSLPLKEVQISTLVSKNPIESLLQSFKPKFTGILYFYYFKK